MTTFTQITPVLRVVDLPRSIDFYTSILGFQVRWRAPMDRGGENCMVSAGPIDLLLSTGDHLGGTPQFTGTLYINVMGLVEFYERIRLRVDLVWPLEEMDYGQLEFGLRDPDGYIRKGERGQSC